MQQKPFKCPHIKNFYCKMRPVKDLNAGMKNFSEMLEKFSLAGGFQAKNLGDAFSIMKEAISEKKKGKCKIFLSFPACIISTGTRGIIKELVKQKLIDVIITASGTIDHDLARLWGNYYQGTFLTDDSKLARQKIHRLGNVFIPQKDYGIILEKKLQPIFNAISKKYTNLSTSELVNEIGKCLEHEKGKEDSIIYWACKNEIPIILPGPYDGAFGYQLWMFQQDHKLNLDIFKDETFLSETIWQCQREKIKTAALVLGGGISKHHTIWWNMFKDGLDYAVYITTAIEEDGSLSGAKTREALTWGKIKQKSRHVTVISDVTIALPLLVNALHENL